MIKARSSRPASRLTTRRKQVSTAEPVGSLTLAKLPARRAAALDALHRSGRAFSVEIAGETVDVAPVWPLPPAGATDRIIRFEAGSTSAALIVPEEEIGRLLERFAPEIRMADFPSEQLAILLEAAIEPTIAMLEAVLGAPLRIIALDAADDQPEPDFGFRLSHSDGTFTCGICDLETDLIERIAAQFPAPVERPQAAADLELPLRICFDAVLLPLTALNSLQPGDVVMLDHPNGAFILIADRVVAALSLDTVGARLAEAPIAIANSQWNWIMTDSLASTAEADEGTIDDIPITIVFELGRRTMPVSEIKTLTGGAIVSLPETGRETVSLVANGKRIGEGELVRIGEGLGVRILSVGEHA